MPLPRPETTPPETTTYFIGALSLSIRVGFPDESRRISGAPSVESQKLRVRSSLPSRSDRPGFHANACAMPDEITEPDDATSSTAPSATPASTRSCSKKSTSESTSG